jgi:hypothetical protein
MQEANLTFLLRGSRIPKVDAAGKKLKLARPSPEMGLNLGIGANKLH